MEGTEFGPYRLIGALDGEEQVWRAHDTAHDRVVALRLLPREAATDPRFTRRFHHELRIAEQLDDPHVVTVHAFGEIDGRLYVDSEWIDGPSLQTVLAGGPLDPARAVTLVEQVATALDSAHAKGLVHLEVMPSNVLLDAAGAAHLNGFGLAVGTGDERSDVHSLAALLYECLTGATPFPDDDTPAAPPRPSEVGMAATFDHVVAKGMAHDPADRYGSAGALARSARAALESAPEPVEPAPPASAAPPKRVRRGIFGWSRRKLVIAGLASVGIIAMVGTTAAAIVMPFLLRTEETASERRASPLTTTTAPAPYIAPLAVRPVGRALVPQGEQCKPGPPPPLAPPAQPATTCDVERKAFYELGPVGVELNLTGANAIKLPLEQFYAVQLVMEPESSARFGQYTGTQIGKQVAFVRDGVVLAAPSISAPINGESLQLSGEMTKETAETIARMLREGA